MILPSLTAEQVAQLSVPEPIERMDSVRVQAEIERHGEAWFTQHQASFPYPRVTDLVSTLVFTSSEEQKRRRLADAAFRFLLQIDFLTVSGGISNGVVGYSNQVKVISFVACEGRAFPVQLLFLIAQATPPGYLVQAIASS